MPTTDFIGTIYCLPLPAIQANNNMQIAVSYMGNLIYTRVYYNNSTWSIWESDRKDINKLNDEMAFIGKTTNSGWSKDSFQIYNNADDDILTLISQITNGNNSQNISLSFQKTGILYYLYENGTYIEGYKLCRPYFTEINQTVQCQAGWHYTGLGVVIPGFARYSFVAQADYNVSAPQGVAICNSDTAFQSWTIYAKTEGGFAVNFSGYNPYENPFQIYMWANYETAGSNNLHLNGWVVDKY